MSGTRQQIQYSLALEPGDRGEPRVSGHQGAEPFVAKPVPESPAVTEQLMEEVCDRENLVRAWKRVRRNKGSPGVDGMTIDDAKDYLRERVTFAPNSTGHRRARSGARGCRTCAPSWLWRGVHPPRSFRCRNSWHGAPRSMPQHSRL